MSIEPKLLRVAEMADILEDADEAHGRHGVDIRALLGHIAALDIELTVARGLNIGDRQVIAKLEADLREAMQTIETAKERIAELEYDLSGSDPS